MKNKFFELVTDELENNKNQKKLQILKMSLLLYIICVSKVVYEELEDLRDDNYFDSTQFFSVKFYKKEKK